MCECAPIRPRVKRAYCDELQKPECCSAWGLRERSHPPGPPPGPMTTQFRWPLCGFICQTAGKPLAALFKATNLLSSTVCFPSSQIYRKLVCGNIFSHVMQPMASFTSLSITHSIFPFISLKLCGIVRTPNSFLLIGPITTKWIMRSCGSKFLRLPQRVDLRTLQGRLTWDSVSCFFTIAQLRH